VNRENISVSKGVSLAPSFAPPSTKTAPTVAITGVEAEEGGRFAVTGVAPPGSQARVYLNGAFVAKVIADLSGLWALKIEKGMQPGNYTVRADGVEPVNGRVLHRAEVPFVFPAPAGPTASPAAALPAAEERALQSQPPASPAETIEEASSAAATVVKEVQTATVLRGDSLWRISRKRLGRGIRYKQIYQVNESQIRNPGLIYPGQIFVMPNDPG
jgi:nucleoid-associated protein YgaU